MTRRRRAQRVGTCPACGEPIRGSTANLRDHLGEHDPEDVGLAPLGERPGGGR